MEWRKRVFVNNDWERDGLLWTWARKLSFHKTRPVSLLSEDLLRVKKNWEDYANSEVQIKLLTFCNVYFNVCYVKYLCKIYDTIAKSVGARFRSWSVEIISKQLIEIQWELISFTFPHHFSTPAPSLLIFLYSMLKRWTVTKLTFQKPHFRTWSYNLCMYLSSRFCCSLTYTQRPTVVNRLLSLRWLDKQVAECFQGSNSVTTRLRNRAIPTSDGGVEITLLTFAFWST